MMFGTQKLQEYKERIWNEIEDFGGIKSFLILILLTLVAIPLLFLYLLLLKPVYRTIRMLIEAKKLGLKESYRKQFHSEEYEKEQEKKGRNEEKERPLIPDGKWKSFDIRKEWPDAYAVDGVAVYGAEGRTLLYVDEHVEEFDVPEGVENIYHRCFAYCDVLTRVHLPSSLMRIGKRAFYDCVSLKEAAIPESVYILEEEVFMNCASLEKVELPSHLTEIPTRMFCNCRSLKVFHLPGTIKVIETEAFRQCYALEQIEMGGHLEEIQERAFENCRSLKEFVMPDSLSSISTGMLNGCHSLEYIHFSSRLKDFGGSCCRDCWAINRISMSPMDKETKTHFREWWEEYAEKVDITKSENPYPESMFWTMDDTLYYGIPRLTSVCLVFCFSKETEFSIPSFVTNVKQEAFTSCRNLHTLRLSPYIKTSCDPWERNCISYGFIYEYWPQVKEVVFDETLKHTEYAFGLIG